MAGRSCGVVDQSVSSLKKLDQYITTGQDIAIDLALDLVENDKRGLTLHVFWVFKKIKFNRLFHDLAESTLTSFHNNKTP